MNRNRRALLVVGIGLSLINLLTFLQASAPCPGWFRGDVVLRTGAMVCSGPWGVFHSPQSLHVTFSVLIFEVLLGTVIAALWILTPSKGKTEREKPKAE